MLPLIKEKVKIKNLSPKKGARLRCPLKQPFQRGTATKRGHNKSPLYNTSFRDLVKVRPSVKSLPRSQLGSGLGSRGDAPLLLILQNKLMRDGRKSMAERVFFQLVKELNQYTDLGSGHQLFYYALEQLKPTLITVTRRVGRNYYQVPVLARKRQQYKIAFQWLLGAAEKNLRSPIHKSLAKEVITILSSPASSEALKSKETMYRTIITNRAYSHYR
jgi:small subunit ribosomal protein S7